MASFDWDVDLDLNGNAINNARMQVLSSDPTGSAGRYYVNSTDDPWTLRIYDDDADEWVVIGEGEIYSAGDGLDLTGTTFSLDLASGGGLEISSTELRIAAAAAGDGLTGGGGSALAVNPGTGLEISSDTVRIAAAAAGNGLTGGGASALAVNTGTGLEISADTVRIAAAAAGNGLTGGGGSALAVNPGTGLEISSDAVRIAAAAAGAGLTGGAGSALAVGAGTGITVNADDIAVNTSVIATVAALNAVKEGIKAKSARVVAVANVNIASPGGTHDGETLVSGTDIILLTAQTTPSQNGPWLYNGAAAALTRPPEADTWAEMVGARWLITEGTDRKGTVWNSAAEDGGTLGTTALTILPAPDLSALVAGDGLDKTGNTIDVDSTVARRNADNTIAGNVIASKATSGAVPVVSGTTSGTGIGVKGVSTAGGSSGAGVRGEVGMSSDVGAAGVFGYNSGPGIGAGGHSEAGTGVQGSSNTGPAFKVATGHGSGAAFDGNGEGGIIGVNRIEATGLNVGTAEGIIWGTSTGSGPAIKGGNASTAGTGVYGEATHATAGGRGVYGRNGSSGIAYDGASVANKVGVFGESSQTGVRGHGAGAGVWGAGDGSATGVRGESETGPAFSVSVGHGTGAAFDGGGKPVIDIANGENVDDAATVGQAGRTTKGNVGDGTATTYTITHNWNTRDVMVEVFANSGDYETRGCRVERTLNTVVLKFNSAVASNARRYLIREV